MRGVGGAGGGNEGEVLPHFTDKFSQVVSHSTLQRLLTDIGWRYRAKGTGLLQDEHERPDVVSAREKHMAFMQQNSHLIIKSAGKWLPDDDMGEVDKMLREHLKGEDPYSTVEQAIMGVDLDMDKPASAAEQVDWVQPLPILMVHQDESSFNANQHSALRWEPGDGSGVDKDRTVPKGKGASVMLSLFATLLGRVHLLGMRTGKKHGHWNIERFGPQLELACEELRDTYHASAIFAFDQSSCHKAFAADALHAHKLNKKDGGGPAGKELQLRDTYWPLDEAGERIGTARSRGGSRVQSLTGDDGKCLGLLSIVQLRAGTDFDEQGLSYSKYSKAELVEIVEGYPDFKFRDHGV